MRIGVLCPSEIAIRRFMPALKKINNIVFCGIGVNSKEERYGKDFPSLDIIKKTLNRGYLRANKIVDEYGGRIYASYEEIISSSELDCIYIPLPPALHYKWAKKALENGKHVLIEKPATLNFNDTRELINIAKEKNLSVNENYMFMFHNQLGEIDELIKNGEIGEVRLYRVAFGFPRREHTDFRYNKGLGGGALYDAGGYTIKYATKLLGNDIKFECANLNYLNDFEVDVYGSASFSDHNGLIVQAAFGMDNDYKCDLEVWGSKGTISTKRVFTAPCDYMPKVYIKKNCEVTEKILAPDDTFVKSITHFMKSIEDRSIRNKDYGDIIKQSELVEKFFEMASMEKINV